MTSPFRKRLIDIGSLSLKTIFQPQTVSIGVKASFSKSFYVNSRPHPLSTSQPVLPLRKAPTCWHPRRASPDFYSETTQKPAYPCVVTFLSSFEPHMAQKLKSQESWDPSFERVTQALSPSARFALSEQCLPIFKSRAEKSLSLLISTPACEILISESLTPQGSGKRDRGS